MDLYLAECKVWKNVFSGIHFIQATKDGEIIKKDQYGLLFENGSGDPFVTFNILPILDTSSNEDEENAYLSQLDIFNEEFKMHPDSAFQFLPILQKHGFKLNQIDPGYFIFDRIAKYLYSHPQHDYIAFND